MADNFSKVIRISSLTEENSPNWSRSQLSESSHAFLWLLSRLTSQTTLDSNGHRCSIDKEASAQFVPFVCGKSVVDSYYPLLDSTSITFSKNGILWKKSGRKWSGIQSTHLQNIIQHQEYFRVSSLELGLFIFISLEPKSQWCAMKKAKPLNVNGPRPTLTWKAWPLLRLVVIFLAHECVVIQPIFRLILIYASKSCKS